MRKIKTRKVAKMSCFSCCLSEDKLSRKSLKKSMRSYKDTKTLASFANLSFKSGTYVIRSNHPAAFSFNDEAGSIVILPASPLCIVPGHEYDDCVSEVGPAGKIRGLCFQCLMQVPPRDSSRRRYIAEEINKIGNKNISANIFSFRELTVATQNFNHQNMIGEGGFGRVYKGQIQDKEVAVKQLDRNGFQGNREFLVEVLMLSLLHHPNLVNLVGYCADGDQRILVYEYLANGSLENHLLDLPQGKAPLDWSTRMKVAAGAAKGLEYLHETAEPPVIYRDFKASNVLLDNKFNAKLSDFGLAKLGPTGDKTHVSTRVMGTYGYCAPEYALTGQLTSKSDVYSFGVVFLEIITGRRVIDNSRPTEEQNLVNWATPLLKDRKKFDLLADPLLEGRYPQKGLHQALAVAAMCLQEEAETRPLMSDVVTALEYLAMNKDAGQRGQGIEFQEREEVEEYQIQVDS